MKCKTCGAMNCMAHGGMAEDMDMPMKKMLPKPMKMAKGGMAKGDHADNHRYNYDDETKQEGVNRSLPRYDKNENKIMHGESHMGKSVRQGDMFGAKKVAIDTIKEGRNVAGGKSHRPLEGLADGGEVEIKMDDDHDMDNELHESLAHELMEAFEKKDKKGVLESIKALVMSCGGKV